MSYSSILSKKTSNNVDFSKYLKSKALSQHKQFDKSLEYMSRSKDCHFDWTSAEPILPPPEHVKIAGSNSFLSDSLKHYSPSGGSQNLRKAIYDKFKIDSITLETENIVIETSTFEILKKLYAILNWDECKSVMIPTPVFGGFIDQLRENRINYELLRTNEPTWKISAKELDNLLELTGSKVFLLINPVNPTGLYYTKKELESLAKIFKKHGVLVISDEILKGITFNESKNLEDSPFSLGAIESMHDSTITLSGLSKSMGLAGLRVSFGVLPDWLINNMSTKIWNCGFAKPIEDAAVAALLCNEENRKYLEETIKGYKLNIETINDWLILLDKELSQKFNPENSNLIFASFLIKPISTNMALISFPGLKNKFFDKKKIESGNDLANCIYETQGVALAPGEASFIDAEKIALRIPLAPFELVKGLEKIRTALKNNMSDRAE